jgi:hypothetical protein
MATKIKIVDPEGNGPHAFQSVASALVDAKDGDIILIKHGAKPEVVVRPVAIPGSVSVTLRPYNKDYKPILVLSKENHGKDTSLFKVQHGQLALEQLEIRLDPGSSYDGTQSIVQLGESAQCSFKNCILSLKKTSNLVKLNVVTFIDLNQMAKIDIPSPLKPLPARVEFHECFARGGGNLVNLHGCRLLHVDVKHSLIALSGLLLDINATKQEMGREQGVHWKMERSSVFTSESLFALRANGKGLTTTHAEIEGSLMVALPPAPEQLVQFPEMMTEEKYLEWKGKQNCYAGFKILAEWQRKYEEVKSHYLSLTLPKFEETEKADNALINLWQATPEWFKPSDPEQERLINGFGVPAEIEQRWLASPMKSDDL